MQQCRQSMIAARRGRSARVVGVAVLVSLGAALPAWAKVVKFPKDKPKVTMQVPDGWSVDYTAIGLEIRSPEKNSLIVADLVKRDKKDVDAWTKAAGQKMLAVGITFAKTDTSPAKAAAASPAATPAAPSALSLSSMAPSQAPDGATKPTAAVPAAAVAGSSGAAIPSAAPPKSVDAAHATPGDAASAKATLPEIAFTRPAEAPTKPLEAFAKPPEASSKPQEASSKPSQGDSNLPSAESTIPIMARRLAPVVDAPPVPPPAAKSAAKINGLAYHVAQFYGAKVKDKPVDVQIVVFNVSKEQVFILEQQSGSDDNRAVGIVLSVKPVS